MAELPEKDFILWNLCHQVIELRTERDEVSDELKRKNEVSGRITTRLESELAQVRAERDNFRAEVDRLRAHIPVEEPRP